MKKRQSKDTAWVTVQSCKFNVCIYRKQMCGLPGLVCSPVIDSSNTPASVWVMKGVLRLHREKCCFLRPTLCKYRQPDHFCTLVVFLCDTFSLHSEWLSVPSANRKSCSSLRSRTRLGQKGRATPWATLRSDREESNIISNRLASRAANE